MATDEAPAPKAPRKLADPITGDAAKGAKLVADRTRGGSCLACHIMGQAGNADQPGNVGPDLSEIGNAGLSDEQLFNFIYDARVYNAETVMPPWGSHGVFTDAEINDMVAFLKTLKKPAVFSRPTGFSWMCSCRHVVISKNSSQVPKPPGRATNASERSAMTALR